MNDKETSAGSSLPILEKTPIGKVKEALREGASGGEQTTLYMLVIQRVEELEEIAARGEPVQGGDGLLLSIAREVLA